MPSRTTDRGPSTVLGVDFGGVIIAASKREEASLFYGGDPLLIPPIADSFAVLSQLTDHLEGRVYVISKAGPRVEGLTRSWLAACDFYSQTGIHAHHLYFVRERREKAPLAAQLGITHFLDDRVDVLSNMDSVRWRYLFAPTRAETDVDLLPPRTEIIHSWGEFLAKLLISLTSE